MKGVGTSFSRDSFLPSARREEGCRLDIRPPDGGGISGRHPKTMGMVAIYLVLKQCSDPSDLQRVLFRKDFPQPSHSRVILTLTNHILNPP